MFKYIYILLAILSPIFSFSQETYVLNRIPKTGFSGKDTYEMYTMDVLSGDRTLLFTLSEADFEALTPHIGFETRIPSFEVSLDKKSIYFLGSEGDLFVYDIASSDLSHLVDLIPKPASAGYFFDNYTRVHHIRRIDDNNFFVGGLTLGVFDIRDYSFNILYQCPSQAAQFEDEVQDIETRYLTKYKEDYLYYNNHTVISKRKIFDIMNNEFFFPILPTYPQLSKNSSPMFLYQYDCDSTHIYLLNEHSDVGFSRDSLELYQINLESKNITLLDRYDGLAHGTTPRTYLVDIKHFNSIEWDDCQVRIDLDEDNSTIEGIDYAPEDFCGLGNFDLADTDFTLGGERRLDSLVFSIPPTATSYARIELASGDYTKMDNGARVILRPTETTSIDDFLGAIRTGKLEVYGAPTTDALDLGITPWYNGISGDTAKARYRFIYPAPDAGVDTSFIFCTDDLATIDISTLHSAMATDGGVLSSMDGSIISTATDLTTGSTFLEYTVGGTSVCSDTAQVLVEIHDNPVVPMYEDVEICYGTEYTVSLASILDDVEWNDGDTSKEKVFSSSGTYSFTVSNANGCSLTESFAITVSEAPQEVKKDTTLCIGESVTYSGTTYTSPSVHTESITSMSGCDSIMTSIDIRYHEAQEPSITGTFGICPEASTDIDIDASFTWTLDGTTVTSPLTLNTAGSYELESIDVNNCKNTHTIEIVAYDRPSITVQDIIDIDYSEGIKLPVSYTGDINTYTWSPPQGIDCNDCPVPTLTEQINTSYQITVVNADGCTAVDTIDVRFRDARYFLPNVVAINPNYPENGVFRLISSTPTDYELYIYDRWGNLVYENPRLSTTTSEGWKPRKDLVQGVYAYLLKFQDKTDGVKVLAGDVTVLKR